MIKLTLRLELILNTFVMFLRNTMELKANNPNVLQMEIITKTRMLAFFWKFIMIIEEICKKVRSTAIALTLSLKVLWDSLMITMPDRRSALLIIS